MAAAGSRRSGGWGKRRGRNGAAASGSHSIYLFYPLTTAGSSAAA